MYMHVLSIGAIVCAMIFVSHLPYPTASAEFIPPEKEVRQLHIHGSETPEVSAASYAIFDVETGDILFSHAADTPRSIASVTKLLLAAQTFAEVDLDQLVTVTAEDVATYGRAGKLHAGEQYTIRELLFPLLLESSNDAATALARHVDAVGFGDITLADGSGLSPANVASAEELAATIRNIYLTEPHIFDITAITQYVGSYTGWVNNSPVRDLPGYKGGKHGYTEAAGRTLVSIFSEEAVADREFGYVILGSDDVRADTEALRTFVARSVQFE